MKRPASRLITALIVFHGLVFVDCSFTGPPSPRGLGFQGCFESDTAFGGVRLQLNHVSPDLLEGNLTLGMGDQQELYDLEGKAERNDFARLRGHLGGGGGDPTEFTLFLGPDSDSVNLRKEDGPPSGAVPRCP